MWSASPYLPQGLHRLECRVFAICSAGGTCSPIANRRPEALALRNRFNHLSPGFLSNGILPLRYRFPMDPIMMVLAAYGVAHSDSPFSENDRSAVEADAVPPVASVPTVFKSASRHCLWLVVIGCCISWNSAGRTGSSS